MQESTMSLTMACLTYLCQQHHELETLRGDITENLRAGVYVLHGFAATNWLDLVEKSLASCPKNVPSSELLHLLKRLSSKRTNSEYSGKAEETIRVVLDLLKEKWPELHSLVLKAAHFRHFCSTSLTKIQEGKTQQDTASRCVLD